MYFVFVFIQSIKPLTVAFDTSIRVASKIQLFMQGTNLWDVMTLLFVIYLRASFNFIELCHLLI